MVRSNRGAKLNLRYEPLTVFVPENKAFDRYDGDTYSDLAFYHLSFEVKTLKLLETTNVMSSVNLDNPPLWITTVNEEIYVNNAKVIQDKSNYVSKSVSGDMGQHQVLIQFGITLIPCFYVLQVLHMIDTVLDPMVRSPSFSPNAYDLLTSTDNWNVGAKTVTKFHQRVQGHRLLEVFKKREPQTFFIPVDSGIDPQKYKMIDRKIILRHVIPNHVLFTRPSEKHVVTLYDEDESPYSLSFEKTNDKSFVKYTSKESIYEEFSSEIILSDIPLKNGVVHLISQPLGNFNKSLKPFPYLPIVEKISRDPEIDVFYKMGSLTKFNKRFERGNVNFTYFVPTDASWNKIGELELEPVDSFNDILARHLVVSDSPYSMQQLASMSRVNNYTDIELHTEGGPLRISVFKIEGEYFIKWKRIYVKVLRPDYECTNGMVHILNGPLADFRRRNLKTKGDSENMGESLVDYWSIVKNIVM